MASGIRLYHPTLRSTVYLVDHPTKVYPLPRHCPTCCPFIANNMPHTLDQWACGGTHVKKTWHFHLDDTGKVIVSKEIFNDLLKVEDMAGLMVDDEIMNPPDQVLGGRSGPKLRFASYKIPKQNDNGKGMG